jgi:hypothetical protein
VLDFNEVVDDISIDRQFWERVERRPDEKSGGSSGTACPPDPGDQDRKVRTSVRNASRMYRCSTWPRNVFTCLKIKLSV